jgi:hypothetical protein
VYVKIISLQTATYHAMIERENYKNFMIFESFILLFSLFPK